MKNKRKNWIRILILVLFVALAVSINWPNGTKIQVPKPKVTFEKSFFFIKIQTDGYLIDYAQDLNIKQGLDLQGGSNLVYSVDMSQVADDQRNDALDSLQKVIENRVNAFGVSEPVIFTSKSGDEYRLTVELAGVKDTNQAMDLIGKTAQLDFREMNAAGDDVVKTNLTGADLIKAAVTFDPTTNEPQIAIEFNGEGARKFEEITARNINKPLYIFLDDSPISYPTVNQAISGGKAQITGQFTFNEARDLAIQLDAGRLPMPITNIGQRTVEATLGQDSIHRSMVAGILGVLVVSLFMIIYYRLLGIISTIGLGLYILLTVALFKLFGVTVTMGGVAALILSIGMTMETDVLVFERIREELRKGRSFLSSSALGFSKAWPSIRDSSAVSLIICGLLIWAGGSVRGFAIILVLGILAGLATTFFGTKALIILISRYKFVENNWLFNVEKEVDKR